MCDVRKKLILANVIIEKYKTQVFEKRKNIEANAVLNGFTTTLLMKLLYLSSLFSVKDGKKSYRETPFGVLNKWIALEKGPAEASIYSAITYNPPFATISYDIGKEDGCKYSPSTTDTERIKNYYEIYNLSEEDNILDKLVEKYDLCDARTIIEQGFDSLVEKLNEKNIDITDPKKRDSVIKYLSDLTHLMLWNASLNRNPSLLATDNIYLLRDEHKELKDRIEKKQHNNTYAAF
ncbi:MAG: SocA family protein [Lentimicrobiaceae bacterium]|jgi:hypothetical protein|nr:SocA family protein [Lentimicrobiaceae bacterium]